MVTEQELIEKIKETNGVKIVVAKKDKKGNYTVFPQVTEIVHTNVQLIGECYAIVFED